MTSKIVIRADGDKKIGMGHIYRTLNLAYALKKKGHHVVFLTTTSIALKVLSKYYECQLLPKNNHGTTKIIQQLKADLIIIDKLNEKLTLLKILKKNCKIMIGIDYTGNNKTLFQFGINMLYQKTGISNKLSLSGFQYSILNRKFLTITPLIIGKTPKSILVLQGGSDRLCFTPKIIDALNCLGDVKITAVLGPAFNCWKSLKKVSKQYGKRLKLLHDVKNMGSIMKKHDIAITAGGMTLLELAHLGIPSIVICGEKFELETANALQKKGFGINLGFGATVSKKKIALSTKHLLSDYALRKNMNHVGTKLIDGKGSERISEFITKLVDKK